MQFSAVRNLSLCLCREDSLILEGYKEWYLLEMNYTINKPVI